MKYRYHCNLSVTKDGCLYTPVDLVFEDAMQLSLQALKIKAYSYVAKDVISHKDLTYTLEMVPDVLCIDNMCKSQPSWVDGTRLDPDDLYDACI